MFDMSESEIHDRLKQARETRYPSAADAARALNVSLATYYGHENGSRGFGSKAAQKYATAYRISLDWLLTGRGPMSAAARPVDVIGYVQAGAEAILYGEGQGTAGTVERPPKASSTTVALEVRGNSMRGIASDGWIIYYDARNDAPTTEMMGKLCVLGLADQRIVVKKLLPGSQDGLFHLVSESEDPILDVAVDWAALVTWIKPR